MNNTLVKKKKFDLTTDLVATNKSTEQVTIAPMKSVLLTIAVEEEFRVEFKTWCVQHRLKMKDAFIQGFKLLKEQNL